MAKEKLNIAFADFQAASQQLGLVASVDGPRYFVKTAAKVKVELNLASASWVVDAGSKAELVDAVVAKSGLTLVKRPKGWAVLEFKTLDELAVLTKLADENVREATTKIVKADKPAKADKPVKVKVEKVKVAKAAKAKVELPEDEKAKIKAANLAKMKEVSDRLKRARETNPGVENFDPVQAKAEVAEFLDTGDVDSFTAPRFLTKEEVNYLV